MTRPLRAQRWHEPLELPVKRPAVPSLEREPWRALRSSFATRFIGKRGGELQPDAVNPKERAELISALEARHLLGAVYAELKERAFVGVSEEQRATLDLLVFGSVDVRETKTGTFKLTFRSLKRKGHFTVQGLYATAFELRRLV